MRPHRAARHHIIVLAVLSLGCGGPTPAAQSAAAPASPTMTVQVESVPPTAKAMEPSVEPEPDEQPLAVVTVEPSGLDVEDLVLGTGAVATEGSQVEVHYVGTLLDGTVFDSSRTRSVPFSFKVGARMVIAGFEQGVTGMRVGGIRRVRFPPELGYGQNGRPPVIPPDAVLVFEFELLGVR